jgi:hypothetical protein
MVSPDGSQSVLRECASSALIGFRGWQSVTLRATGLFDPREFEEFHFVPARHFRQFERATR